MVVVEVVEVVVVVAAAAAIPVVIVVVVVVAVESVVIMSVQVQLRRPALLHSSCFFLVIAGRGYLPSWPETATQGMSEAQVRM